jgi:hypothetical protein
MDKNKIHQKTKSVNESRVASHFIQSCNILCSAEGKKSTSELILKKEKIKMIAVLAKNQINT